jgi:hypothetical protein
LQSSLEQKERLQRVFFPDGLTFTKDGFGTAASNSFFNVLQGFTLESNFGVPDGIRTRVTAVKGRCPRPLDDGDAERSSRKLPGDSAMPA